MDGRDVRMIALFYQDGSSHMDARPIAIETACEAIRRVEVPMVEIRTLGKDGRVEWFVVALSVFEKFCTDLKTISRLALWNHNTTFAGSDPRRAFWRRQDGDELHLPRSVQTGSARNNPTGC